MLLNKMTKPRSPRKRKTPPRLPGGNKVIPVSGLKRACDHGQDCIEYDGKYFSVANASGADECKVVDTLDGLAPGVYTYVLFAPSVENVQTLIDSCCSAAPDRQVRMTTRSAARRACKRLVPLLRIVVGKTHTMWERGTKHSCLVHSCLADTDVIIGAGELKITSKKGGKRVAECNAFSGTYVLNYIKSESERRKMSMNEVNKLFLDSCLLGLLRHMSPGTTVRVSKTSFITGRKLKPYVRDRLKEMRSRNIPVRRFDSLAECKSYKPAVELARLNSWKKSQERRLETMKRFANPVQLSAMREKMEKQYDAKREKIIEVPEWTGADLY
jgi:hypothetical protein